MSERLNLYGSLEHEPFIFPPAEETQVGALLIHGFMGSPRELRPLGMALAAQGVTAHGIALPGFGRDVDRLGDLRFEDWIDHAADVWSKITVRYRRSVLIGFSMGGSVAIHLAAKRPPDRLILLAPLYRISDRRAVALPVFKRVRREMRPFAGASFHERDVRESFRMIDPDLDLDDPEIQARLRQELPIPFTALDELRKLASRTARVGRKAIAPTLVLQGSDDRIVRPRDTRRLLASLGGVVTYRELPVDHMLVLPDRSVWPEVRDLVIQHLAPLMRLVT